MENYLLKYPTINENISIRVKPNQITFFLNKRKKSIIVSNNIWLLYKKFDGTKNISQI